MAITIEKITALSSNTYQGPTMQNSELDEEFIHLSSNLTGETNTDVVTMDDIVNAISVANAYTVSGLSGSTGGTISTAGSIVFTTALTDAEKAQFLDHDILVVVEAGTAVALEYDLSVSSQGIVVHPDETKPPAGVTFQSWSVKRHDTTLVEKVLLNTFKLYCWILVTNNVTLDLRNTNIDIISSCPPGSGNGVGGAGIQLKAYSSTAAETGVLDNMERARLLTGNTVMIISNRVAPRLIYGPLQHNAYWENDSGDTTIMIDAGTGLRYDWSSSIQGNSSQLQTTNTVLAQMGIIDFKPAYKVNIVGVSGQTNVQMITNPASKVNNLNLVGSVAGGGLAAGTGPNFQAFGGEFKRAVTGSGLLGVWDAIRLGVAAKDVGLTIQMTDLKIDSRTLTIRRWVNFWDVVGILGSQTEGDLATATNTVTTVQLEANDNGGDNNTGMMRVSYKWDPTFKDSAGVAFADDGGRLDVITGDMYEGNSQTVATTFPTDLEHLGNTDMNVELKADGKVEWTDPFTRSRPEPLRTDKVRPYVRMPNYWTLEGDDDDHPTQIWRIDKATWHLYKAGYKAPTAATELDYPFVGGAFGNLTEDVIVALDSAFGSTEAEVTAERVIVKQMLVPTTSGATGRELGESDNIYKMLMMELEVNETVFTTVASVHSKLTQLDIDYAPKSIKLDGTSSVLRLLHGTGVGNSAIPTGKNIKIDATNAVINVRAEPQSGQTYGATSRVSFGNTAAGFLPVPDCTIDAPNLSAKVDEDNPIDGLTLEQNCTLTLNIDSDQAITVDNVRGQTLTINNSGTGTLSLSTNSGSNVTAGTRVTALVGIAVSGAIAGTATQPSQLGLYPVNADSTLGTATIVDNKASHTFSGLTVGSSYKLAWSAPGYEPIVQEFASLSSGSTAVVLAPAATPNAGAESNIPADVSITMVSYSDSATAMDHSDDIAEITIDTVRGTGANEETEINGIQTNALFESVKSHDDFLEFVAETGVLNLIAHQSSNSTSLLQSRHKLVGEATGICRHAIQAVSVHDKSGSLVSGAEPTVETKDATIDSSTHTLPTLIILPTVAGATYDDVDTLLDAAVDEIESNSGGGGNGGGGEVTGFSTAAETEMLKIIRKSGAV